MLTFVYGHERKREGSELAEILPVLVQANVIDSFSASLLESSGAHIADMSEFHDKDKKEFSPLNIGWQTARYIDYHFPRPDAEGNGLDLYSLALAISAFFGSQSGRIEFENDLAGKIASENHKNEKGNLGRSNTRSVPRTKHNLLKYTLEMIECSEKDKKIICHFLNKLGAAFDYNAKGNLSNKQGISELIVVRDIWALLACLLDKSNMWSTSKPLMKPSRYMAEEQQELRIISYIQDCIAYAGRQAGFDGCPW